MLLLPVLVAIQNYAYAQEVVVHDSLKRDSIKHHADSVKFQKKANDISKQYDFGNLVTAVLHPKKKPDSVFKKPSGITVIPNIASNPSIGFQLGIKAVAGRKLGGDPNTLLSVAATSISYTTKGILYFYINHNVYTPGNKWNFQGNIVAAKSVTPDFGLGIGQPDPGGSAADQALVNAGRKGRAYHSIYLNLREKVYKEVEKNLFVGAGVSFDIRTKIQDKADTTNHLTPYNIYSDEHGFKRDSYRADGLLFNVQYTTRDNQNRAYKGIYADAGFRVNQTWMGSTKSAVQFTTDFRKYFSLSSENPEHVIAFWNWGSYLISGDIPYLELPGTAKDGSFRSGRGYTTGYFKGTRFNYSEVEYRFPILKNKFISGVAFFSEQTANDEAGTKLFQKFQPGGGGGLRVLFNKATRTNLCLDYAFGKFGSKGFFLGLNEAF
ncbi:BamA/TamA family outer membrane protein [Mucilaginibacter ginsenosidivorax]|uniref:BamA/TamA family outer membrane protein n=1 Tax=Mucilaginibacter ginsenosidivorax TaxID=862126 RepID=A0A5B8WCM4_9SPHI|nr:BamA/TamA family outer membrane protein [Mucilaginibacter ginsenosidivorax]